MTNKLRYIYNSEKLLIYLSMAYAFVLPFSHLLVVFIVFLLLAKTIKNPDGFKLTRIANKKLCFAIILFYALHLLGLAYTQNSYAGWFDVKTKVVLIIFVFLYGNSPFTHQELRSIMHAFIAGLCLAALSCLGYACYVYFLEGRVAFFYQEFAIFLHPSYFALYLNFAIGWMINQLMSGPTTNTGGLKLPSTLVLIIFFSGIVILLSSKLGIITLFLMYLLFAIYYILNRKKYFFGTIALLLLLTVVSLISKLPYVKERINSAMEAVTTKNNSAKTSSESTAVRILIWQAAHKIISRHFWIGVGTGDTKDMLLKTYQEEGITGAYTHNLNAHNQFYQEFIALGLTGFISLLLVISVPLVQAIVTNNFPLLILTLLLLINFLTESMLETQAGVSFTAFFLALFGFNAPAYKKTNLNAYIT